MSESIKATRATLAIGALTVDAFMLPDGSYRMSQTQAADLVGLSERNAREFLDSKTFERLAGKGYTPAIFDINESRRELNELKTWLRDHAIDPYELPNSDRK